MYRILVASSNVSSLSDDDASSVWLDCTLTHFLVTRTLLMGSACSYLSQILHGCKNAYCDTPTCLSCSRRTASKPFRPPTQLTARALAHYLASQDKPRRGLCPHELNVAPESFEIGDSEED